MSDEPDSGRLARRVGAAIVLALVLHLLILSVLRGRHRSADSGATDPAAAATKPLAVDLRAGGPVRPLGLALASGLHTAPLPKSGAPVLPKTAALPRNRLEFSAALGDGDSGRPGFDLDRLLAPLRRVARRAAAAPAPYPYRATAADDASAGPAAASLALIQSRAALLAANQPVPLTRIEPRESVPVPPTAPAASTESPGEAEIGRFFTALTAQLVETNQLRLAAAIKAGPRETVEVRFVVGRDGRVSAAGPVTPSDSPALDAAAVEVVNAASPLPPPPAALPQSRLELTFPVQVYR